MIGVTIGVGAGWAALAEQTARRMERMTGVGCVALTEKLVDCAHPSWIKCHLPDLFPRADEFFVFDADILPLRPWDPARLFADLGRPFMAVPEPNGNPDLLQECKDHHLGYPDTYVNTGLMIFGREHKYILDLAWQMHPDGGRWFEQTAINVALSDNYVECCRLPRRYNLIAQRGRINSIYCRGTLRDAINVHTCAMKDPEELMDHHQRISDYVDTGRAGRTRIDWLRTLPPNSTGAEIGVFQGDFSREILQHARPAKLHLVDLFAGHIISGDVDGRDMRLQDMAAIRPTLDALSPVVRTHQADSVAWLQAQPEASLDWVYIDTSHTYEHTAAELAAALRPVRPGGIIAGHDFSRAHEGVIQAVIEFVRDHQSKIEIFDGDLLPSFAIHR
jgi:hypothetical protein